MECFSLRYRVRHDLPFLNGFPQYESLVGDPTVMAHFDPVQTQWVFEAIETQEEMHAEVRDYQ